MNSQPQQPTKGVVDKVKQQIPRCATEKWLRDFWSRPVKIEKGGKYAVVVLPHGVAKYQLKNVILRGLQGDFCFCGPRCLQHAPGLPRNVIHSVKHRPFTNRFWWIPPHLRGVVAASIVAAWPCMLINGAAFSFAGVASAKSRVILQPPPRVPDGGSCKYKAADGKPCRQDKAVASIMESLDENGKALEGPFQIMDWTARKLVPCGYPTTRCVFGSAGVRPQQPIGTVFYMRLNEVLRSYLKRGAFQKRFISPDGGPHGVCHVFLGLAEDHKWRYDQHKGCIRCPWYLRAAMQVAPRCSQPARPQKRRREDHKEHSQSDKTLQTSKTLVDSSLPLKKRYTWQ